MHFELMYITFSIVLYNIQIMMFRTRLLLGRMGMYDQYQDWRLDVDNMNYEVSPFCCPSSATDLRLHTTVFI